MQPSFQRAVEKQMFSGDVACGMVKVFYSLLDKRIFSVLSAPEEGSSMWAHTLYFPAHSTIFLSSL